VFFVEKRQTKIKDDVKLMRAQREAKKADQRGALCDSETGFMAGFSVGSAE
jgi:hypothetical protein